MPRYASQPYDSTCGPTAVINAAKWAGTNGDGIIMQAGSLVIEPIESDVTFMNKKGK